MDESVTCAVCPGAKFPNREAYLPHTKTGWHDENTNRMMRGQPKLTEEEWTKEFGPKIEVCPVAEEPARIEEAPPMEKIEEEPVQEEPAKEPEVERPPPGHDEVDACVVFDYKGERWNHMFRVSKGCTVLDVKKAMIKPGCPEEDAISFDLQKRRVRLNNYDTVDQTDTFDFVYIGPDEGRKKVDRDMDLKAQRDEQSRQFRMRNELAQKEQAADASRVAAPPAAVATPAAPSTPLSELVITVTIDEDIDLVSTFKVAPGSTILTLKRLIAAADPTGAMTPDTFGLCLPTVVTPLPNSTLLSEKHVKLKATDPIEADSQVQKPVGASHEQKPVGAVSEEDPPCDESGPNVMLYVHHLDAKALEGKTLPVCVPKTVTVRYLRREVCNKIGRPDISAITLHKKGGTSSGQSTWPKMADDELLGETREFFARGPAELIAAAVPLQRVCPKAAPAAEPAKSADPKAKGIPAPKKIPGGLDFLVTHDRKDHTLEACLPKGKKVTDLKRAICDRVLRGPYTRVVLADSQGNLLVDDALLDKMSATDRETIRLDGIDICPPFSVDLKVVHAETASKVSSVTLDDTATITDVKKALVAKHGGKPADVKIAMTAKKPGAPFTPMADGMRLNGKRELFGIGPLMDNLRTS